MRTVALGLLPLTLAAPATGQEVTDCAAPPPVTALVEPWEESTAVLAGGAIRLAVIEADGVLALLALTLPPVGAEPEPLAPPERRCRLVTEGASGFAGLDLSALGAQEDAKAGTLSVRITALRFVPESTELEEVTLALTFGAADGTLAAHVEAEEGEAP